MKPFFIFNYAPEIEEGSKPYIATFLFIPGEFIPGNLSEELKIYFQSNLIPDELFILGGKDIEKDLMELFIHQYPSTFHFIYESAIPRFQDNVHVLSFDGNGEIELHSKNQARIVPLVEEIINDGLRKIFVDRGGLIRSRYSHHFVFPSGKHSESFLRTGNILMYGPEIYFIAFKLLSRYKPDEHKMILCDTSSISSLAYALIDLKRRLSPKFLSPPINSFKSYSVFEEQELAYGRSALILISSSTSGGIIPRLLNKMPSILEDNVVLLYFLGKSSDFRGISKNVICNLNNKHSKTGTGLVPFDTHSPEECKLCSEKHSLAVNVTGDIFLSENPRIDRVTLGVKHAPVEIARFAEEFIAKKESHEHILKCNYKENAAPFDRHNIFVDMQLVFRELGNPNSNRYPKFRKLFYDKIQHHVPAQVKIIIRLDDLASEQMAQIIQEQLRATQISVPDIITPDEIATKIGSGTSGSAVVVASCMLSGKNLLLISKQLREFDQLSIVYFVGLVRTKNKKNFEFIRSNLVQGAKGKMKNSFVDVGNLCLPDDSQETVWQKEISFLGELLDYLELKSLNNSDEYKFYKERKDILESANDSNRGLADKIFYNTLATCKEQRLTKNFAFLECEIQATHSQADVYFIMANILNHLRQGQHAKDSLIQTEYCRQILDPSNFLRYNDGIIQSSILRASTAQELAYDLELDASLQITQVVENEIELYKKGLDESLHEFVYAIATGHLRLKHSHRKRLFEKIEGLNNPLLSTLCEFYLHKKEKIKLTESVSNQEL